MILYAISCFLFCSVPTAVQAQEVTAIPEQIYLNIQLVSSAETNLLFSWDDHPSVTAYHIYIQNLDTNEPCVKHVSNLSFFLFFGDFTPCHTYEIMVCAEGGITRGDRVWSCETINFQLSCVA
jgi:hypothetical protein